MRSYNRAGRAFWVEAYGGRPYSVERQKHPDAAASERDRTAARLARWIISTHPAELHVRHLQRDVRLPGLRTAEQIRAAAAMLAEADWLREPAPGNKFGHRGRIAHAVNPRLWQAAE